MKIKLDENLPALLTQALEVLGHDVDTSYTEGLAGCSDEQVWAAVQTEKRFLITQDLDFSDVRRFSPGTHCGILVVPLALAESSCLNGAHHADLRDRECG